MQKPESQGFYRSNEVHCLKNEISDTPATREIGPSYLSRSMQEAKAEISANAAAIRIHGPFSQAFYPQLRLHRPD